MTALKVVALSVVAAALFLGTARRVEATAMACVERCVSIYNGGGQFLGFGCGPGTEGYGCQATTTTCAIFTGGGCGGETMIVTPSGMLVVRALVSPCRLSQTMAA